MQLYPAKSIPVLVSAPPCPASRGARKGVQGTKEANGGSCNEQTKDAQGRGTTVSWPRRERELKSDGECLSRRSKASEGREEEHFNGANSGSMSKCHEARRLVRTWSRHRRTGG